jgi:hypothetical protein
MEWFIQNKEWLLSGIAVSVPIAIIGWLFVRRRRQNIQKQRSGDGSVNIQIGGSINIAKKKVEKND